MKWFRLYYEARNDAKLATLTDEQHRVWFNLLCYAAEQEKNRGTTPNQSRARLAIEVARGNIALLNEVLIVLDQDHLDIVSLTESSVSFIHFPSRQFDKPSDEPSRVSERVKKHRNAKKRDVTPLKASTGLPSPEVSSLSGSDPDSDTYTDTEVKRPDNAKKRDVTPVNARKAPFGESGNNREKTENQKIWDAFIGSGLEGPETKEERGKWNRGIKSLVDAHVTGEEASELILEWLERFPNYPYHPIVISSNLTQLRGPNPKTNHNGHNSASSYKTDEEIQRQNEWVLAQAEHPNLEGIEPWNNRNH